VRGSSSTSGKSGTSGLRVLVAGAVLGQPMGGVRRHNAELLPRLARLLHEAGGALAVLEGHTPIAFELGPHVERLASDVPAGPPLARVVHERRALRQALAAARAAGRPFDLVHTAHLPAPRGLGLPFTLTLHDLRTLDAGAAPLTRRLIGRTIVASAARRAAALIAVSESVRQRCIRELGVDAARTHVVPNAADHLDVLPRAPARTAALLCVGHLEPRKNLELVLRALAHDPTLPDLALAGAAKGDHEERLRALAHELQVAARVRFLGPFEERELAGLYATCAAVVVPSSIEGFGLAALEAQRACAPLAIARIPALLEVAGSATPNFAPDDPAGCATAIRAALAAPPATLTAARTHAARFTWDASAHAWHTALQSAAR